MYTKYDSIELVYSDSNTYLVSCTNCVKSNNIDTKQNVGNVLFIKTT